MKYIFLFIYTFFILTLTAQSKKMAIKEYNEGNYLSSLKLFKERINANTDGLLDVEDFYFIGMCYSKLDSFSLSNLYLDTVIRVLPDFYEATYLRGVNSVKINTYDSFKNAIADFERVKQFDSSNKSLDYKLAILYFYFEEYEKCIPLFTNIYDEKKTIYSSELSFSKYIISLIQMSKFEEARYIFDKYKGWMNQESIYFLDAKIWIYNYGSVSEQSEVENFLIELKKKTNDKTFSITLERFEKKD